MKALLEGLLVFLVLLGAVLLGIWVNSVSGTWGPRGSYKFGGGQVVAALAFPSGATMVFTQRPGLEYLTLSVVVTGKDGEKLYNDSLKLMGVQKIEVLACGKFAHVLIEGSAISLDAGGGIIRMTYNLGESVPCQMYTGK